MALVVYDRVQETTATTGTGTITLGGAVAGYQSFAVVGNGNTTFYCIVNNSAWEVGIGTYTSSGTTLARTTILSNSNGTTSPITLSGASSVFVTYPASKSINYDANGVATIGSTLGYSDTGIIGSFASTIAGYNQVVIQNKSSATNASSNFNVSNDSASSSAGYAELGINSSTFTGTGSFNIAGASYLASASTDLTIGTYGAYNVHFVTNSSTTDAMTIYNSGGVSLGGQPDPGIGTLYANNVYLGFTTITAAAGTTVLTNSSSGWQQVVGTTTQTIQLPNATTLYKGLAYTIANNSTGSVTIKDSASTTIDTTVSGGTSVLVLTANGTSAGTWVAYSYVPSTYDFSTTTANFGNATITNAVWNGTAIASGYGGTGLTTFTAANYALYSTSSSALTAGTLPVAAGGTGATTLTSNGVLYGTGTTAVGATSAGTTGQVLIATTSGAPSWGAIPSTAAVTSFSAGTTGLTPSSATTGAVTLAGTLATTNGGTGLTTFTAANNALYSTSSSALTAGTLPTAAGGTGLTSFTANGAVYASSTSVLTTGTLPIASGGTNSTATPTAGGVGYGTGTAHAYTAVGTSGQVLTSNGASAPSWATLSSGTVTSVTGTSPVSVATGTTTPVISLATGYGDTQNPYASKTANYFLAAPNGAAGAPTFRAVVAADIPTLNQSTTGSAGSVANSVTFNNGGAGGASGSTFNGSGVLTVSYNTVGAAPTIGSTSITTLGTIATGTWNGSSIATTYTAAKVTDVQAGTGVSVSATTGSVSVSIGQAVATSSNVQFNSIGVNTAGSATAGEIRATNNITAYYTSDKQFKENIQPIQSALDKVDAIGGKTFDWTDAYLEAHGGEDGYFVQRSDFGVIAQDVQAVFPIAIRTRDDGTLAVDYDKLVALAFQAIKELNAEIVALKGR